MEHSLLTNALVYLGAAVLAVPLAKLRPRQGRYARIGIAILVYFVYSNLLAATRVWSATECLRKAGAAGDEPLTLGPRAEDGWTLLHSGSLVTATVPLRMDGSDDPFVLAVTWRRSGSA